MPFLITRIGDLEASQGSSGTSGQRERMFYRFLATYWGEGLEQAFSFGRWERPKIPLRHDFDDLLYLDACFTWLGF
jgi:hypothetical protein